MDDIEKRLREFLRTDPDTREKMPGRLSPDTSLFESGLADSFSLIKIISFIEKEFGIEIGSDDMKIKNFDTLSSIKNLVSKKQK